MADEEPAVKLDVLVEQDDELPAGIADGRVVPGRIARVRDRIPDAACVARLDAHSRSSAWVPSREALSWTRISHVIRVLARQGSQAAGQPAAAVECDERHGHARRGSGCHGPSVPPWRVPVHPEAAGVSGEPVLLDEWQAVPGVLGAVKRAVDTDPRPGRFLVTGSVRAATIRWTGRAPAGSCGSRCTAMTVREKLGARVGRPSSTGSPRAGPRTSAPETPDLRGYVELALRGGFPEAALRLSETAAGPGSRATSRIC